jgi:flagellum-specific peptidoglycan hydrolase FlgJ
MQTEFNSPSELAEVYGNVTYTVESKYVYVVLSLLHKNTEHARIVTHSAFETEAEALDYCGHVSDTHYVDKVYLKQVYKPVNEVEAE